MLFSEHSDDGRARRNWPSILGYIDLLISFGRVIAFHQGYVLVNAGPRQYHRAGAAEALTPTDGVKLSLAAASNSAAATRYPWRSTKMALCFDVQFSQLLNLMH